MLGRDDAMAAEWLTVITGHAARGEMDQVRAMIERCRDDSEQSLEKACEALAGLSAFLLKHFAPGAWEDALNEAHHTLQVDLLEHDVNDDSGRDDPENPEPPQHP